MFRSKNIVFKTFVVVALLSTTAALEETTMGHEKASPSGIHQKSHRSKEDDLLVATHKDPLPQNHEKSQLNKAKEGDACHPVHHHSNEEAHRGEYEHKLSQHDHTFDPASCQESEHESHDNNDHPHHEHRHLHSHAHETDIDSSLKDLCHQHNHDKDKSHSSSQTENDLHRTERRHVHNNPYANSRERAEDNLTNNIWKQSLGATTLITFGGNASILLVFWSKISETRIRVMVLFAVGGLLGDVFLHLLPHALEAGNHIHSSHVHNHDHDHHHHHHDNSHEHNHIHNMDTGLFVIAGILTFFIIEKVLRNVHSVHGHSHSNRTNDEISDKEKEVRSLMIQPGAILNLVADSVHNFTDGMAIAAAFKVSESTGYIMTGAVLFHEIPHEIGDFAVLLNQGMTPKQAFLAQFVSAIGAFGGCIIGLVSTTTEPKSVLSFTAGGFIYVALTDIIPDILEHPSSLQETVQQVLAFGVGVGMMVLIALYEP